jgi:hypothetical protein
MGIIFAFGAPALVIIVLAVLRHQQRMEMIRQGMNPDTQALQYPGKKSLLWGLLLTAIGLAAVIGGFFQYDRDISGFGFLVAGAGIALLIYWKLTEPDRERARRLYEERYLELSGPQEKRNPPASEPGNADTFR